MMKRTILLVIGIWAYAGTFAQETTQDATSTSLTFKEAVKMGLENNLNLNQQKNLLIANRVDKTSGLLSFGPSISISGNTGRNDGNSFNQQEGRAINGVRDFTSASIDANMPLFRGLSVMNGYRQSASLYEAQLQNVNRTNQDVITNIARQYLTCLLDQRLVVINEKNLESQEQQYNQIFEQVSAGSRAEVDLKNQEYQVKNANLLLLRAKNTLRNDKAVLAQTLQLDPAIAFGLEEPAWPMGGLEDLSLEELYALGLSRRSDLKMATFNEKAAQFGYQATKGSYFPSVSLFASYGSAYNYVHRSATNLNPTNRDFEQQFINDNTQLYYGLSFRIPLYNAFQTRSNVVRNRILYENSRLATENAELTVKSEILLAYQNLRDAQLAFEAAKSQLAAASISTELERERYRLGISDIVALTQANQLLTRAEAEFESARYTLMFQKLMINYATGTLSFEEIP
jgi:outer membrane protein